VPACPPLGVVDVVYGVGDPVRASQLAAADGFMHIDVLYDVDPATLALPVGWATAFPKPAPGRTATPAPPAGERAWERALRWWRAAPGALVEPWAGACINSVETVRAFAAEVPGVRFLIDTGHVADWGGDPCELLEFADHVQLRQGAPGTTQLPIDDRRGVVDFVAVLRRLEELDYRGKVSVEYFDLPDFGWRCVDPHGWALALADYLRSL
jgi:sugar phosphate isomerase/epimerase